MADPAAGDTASHSGQPPPASARELSGGPQQLWWMLGVAGALSLIAGIVVLAAPKSSLLAIALILGIYLVVLGLAPILAAVFGPDRGERSGLALVMGAFAVVAGIVVITRPDATVKGVAIVFGIFLLISGVRHLLLARYYVEGRWIPVLRGALEVIGGVIVIAWPKIGLATLALIIGVELILSGLVQLWAAYVARREFATPSG